MVARMEGRDEHASRARRTWLDWLLIGGATCIFVGFGVIASVPQMEIQWGWLVGLTAAMLLVLAAGGIALWRITRFN